MRTRLATGIATSRLAVAPSTLSTVLLFSGRRYVNVLYRFPPQHSVPTHSASGEEVDTDLFMRQLKDLFLVLKQTQLVEQHYDVVLPMPKYGREHRSSEISETLRYMRACGATGDFNHILQDVKGGAASGGDFVSTSHGIFMGYGTSRTNKLSMMALTGGSASSEAAAAQQRALNVEPIEIPAESPPLADLLAFAGNRTLIVQDTVCGRNAAEVAVQKVQKVPWQVLRVEPGCSFLSHLCGAKAVYDVLVDQDFPNSMERIGEAGLNPFPVEWSEPRKLGVTMRSVCLVARFARGSMSAGGYADSDGHRAGSFNYHSRNIAKNSRLFHNGHRRHGDSGAPLEAQLRSGELPDPVFQPPPRYAPPMHNRGALVTDTEDAHK